MVANSDSGYDCDGGNNDEVNDHVVVSGGGGNKGGRHGGGEPVIRAVALWLRQWC